MSFEKRGGSVHKSVIDFKAYEAEMDMKAFSKLTVTLPRRAASKSPSKAQSKKSKKHTPILKMDKESVSNQLSKKMGYSRLPHGGYADLTSDTEEGSVEADNPAAASDVEYDADTEGDGKP